MRPEKPRRSVGAQDSPGERKKRKTRSEKGTAADESQGTGFERHRAAIARGKSAAEGREGVERRDENARRRDRDALERGRAADARDRDAEQAIERAPNPSLQAALDDAAEGRDKAAADRARAAEDRENAARDREAAAAALEHAHIDALTGAYRREIGADVLQNEIDRARRGSGRMVLAFVDVDGLKRVNDTRGHLQGDALLRTAVATIRSKMRSFEPIVRYGGDEFLCAFGDLDLAAVGGRFEEIGQLLRDRIDGASVSVGLAELRSDDGLEDLIARADQALVRNRG